MPPWGSHFAEDMLLTEVNELTQGHTACENKGRDSNQVFSDIRRFPSQQGRNRGRGAAARPGAEQEHVHPLMNEEALTKPYSMSWTLSEGTGTRRKPGRQPTTGGPRLCSDPAASP